jgi:hypothetical protein
MFLGLLLNMGGDRYPKAVPRANVYLILQPLSRRPEFHFPFLDFAWASAASSFRSSQRPISIPHGISPCSKCVAATVLQ